MSLIGTFFLFLSSGWLCILSRSQTYLLNRPFRPCVSLGCANTYSKESKLRGFQDVHWFVMRHHATTPRAQIVRAFPESSLIILMRKIKNLHLPKKITNQSYGHISNHLKIILKRSHWLLSFRQKHNLNCRKNADTPSDHSPQKIL